MLAISTLSEEEEKANAGRRTMGGRFDTSRKKKSIGGRKRGAEFLSGTDREKRILIGA